MNKFVMVYHTVEHAEIVNITKNPPSDDDYVELEVRKAESPSIPLYSKKDCVEDVLNHLKESK